MGKFTNPPDDIPRQCWNKHAGKQKVKLTETEAKLRAAQRQRKSVIEINAYECEHCGHWHTGRAAVVSETVRNLNATMYLELGPRVVYSMQKENSRSKTWRLRAITRPYKKKLVRYIMRKNK